MAGYDVASVRGVAKRTLFCLWLVEVVEALCMGVATPFRKPHRLQADDIVLEALRDVHVEGDARHTTNGADS